MKLYLLAPCAAVAFLATMPANAATKTWTDGGADVNWNNPANWSPTGAPANGDDLVFPSSMVDTSVNNNLSGRTFGSLTIQKGITITGNAFTLTGGLGHTPGGVGGVSTIEPDITLGASQTFTSGGGALSSLIFGGNVTFGTHVLTLAGSRGTTFGGLTGSSNAASGFVKTGAGALRLDSSGIFILPTAYTHGIGSFDVDGIFNPALNMIGGTLTGEGQLLGGLDASGGTIIPDAGDLQVSGNTTLRGNVILRVALTGPSDESALEASGGTVTIQDQATIEFAANAYVPARGDTFLVLQKSTASAITGAFSNLAQNGEIVDGTSILTASYTGGNGNDFTLSTTSVPRVWDGGATLNDNWDDATNWANNVAPLAGDTLVFPTGIGSTDRGMDNNFPEPTTFRQLVFNGDDFTVRGAFFRLSHGMVLAPGVRANVDTDVALLEDQIFTFGENSVLHLDLLDSVETTGRTLTLESPTITSSDDFARVDGTISGAGTVRIASGSSLAFSANSDYTGPTVIEAGAILRVLNREEALGSAAGGTTVGGELHLEPDVGQFSRLVIDEPLTLSPDGTIGTRGPSTFFESDVELRGGIQLLNPGIGRLDAVNTPLRVSSVISGVGSLAIETVQARVIFEGADANTFTGAVNVERGELRLEKASSGVNAISGSILNINGGAKVETRQEEQIADGCQVTVGEGSRLRIGDDDPYVETIGALTLQGDDSGLISALGSELRLNGDLHQTGAGTGLVSCDLVFKARATVIDVADRLHVFNHALGRQGDARARKTGPGEMFLQGADVSIPIEVAEGVVDATGLTLPQPVFLDGGTLRALGNLAGGVTSLTGGGRLEAGNSFGSVSELAAGPLFLNGASTVALDVVNAASTANYDHLVVTGSVSLGGAVLEIGYLGGFSVSIGESIIPLFNDGSDAIVGTFAGLPQGALIPIPAANGGGGWIISYTGGTGNDVSLTRVTVPAGDLNATITGFFLGAPDGNGNRPLTLTARGVPGLNYQRETSPNLVIWTLEGAPVTAAPATGAFSLDFIASPPVRPNLFLRIRRL